MAQSSAESEYNSAYTEVMDIAYFRMLNITLLNKYIDVVPYQASIIILDIKLAICMANSGKDIKHTRHISRIMHSVRKF